MPVVSNVSIQTVFPESQRLKSEDNSHTRLSNHLFITKVQNEGSETTISWQISEEKVSLVEEYSVLQYSPMGETGLKYEAGNATMLTISGVKPEKLNLFRVIAKLRTSEECWISLSVLLRNNNTTILEVIDFSGKSIEEIQEDIHFRSKKIFNNLSNGQKETSMKPVDVYVNKSFNIDLDDVESEPVPEMAFMSLSPIDKKSKEIDRFEFFKAQLQRRQPATTATNTRSMLLTHQIDETNRSQLVARGNQQQQQQQQQQYPFTPRYGSVNNNDNNNKNNKNNNNKSDMANNNYIRRHYQHLPLNRSHNHELRRIKSDYSVGSSPPLEANMRHQRALHSSSMPNVLLGEEQAFPSSVMGKRLHTTSFQPFNSTNKYYNDKENKDISIIPRQISNQVQVPADLNQVQVQNNQGHDGSQNDDFRNRRIDPLVKLQQAVNTSFSILQNLQQQQQSQQHSICHNQHSRVLDQVPSNHHSNESPMDNYTRLLHMQQQQQQHQHQNVLPIRPKRSETSGHSDTFQGMDNFGLIEGNVPTRQFNQQIQWSNQAPSSMEQFNLPGFQEKNIFQQRGSINDMLSRSSSNSGSNSNSTSQIPSPKENMSNIGSLVSDRISATLASLNSPPGSHHNQSFHFFPENSSHHHQQHHHHHHQQQQQHQQHRTPTLTGQSAVSISDIDGFDVTKQHDMTSLLSSSSIQNSYSSYNNNKLSSTGKMQLNHQPSSSVSGNGLTMDSGSLNSQHSNETSMSDLGWSNNNLKSLTSVSKSSGTIGGANSVLLETLHTLNNDIKLEHTSAPTQREIKSLLPSAMLESSNLDDSSTKEDGNKEIIEEEEPVKAADRPLPGYRPRNLRRKTEFCCHVCRLYCTSLSQWTDHCSGRKHAVRSQVYVSKKRQIGQSIPKSIVDMLRENPATEFIIPKKVKKTRVNKSK